MSENLDLVRSMYAAWERGDFKSAEWAHPEMEYVFVDGPTPGRWTGQAGLAKGMREFLSAWKDFRSEAEEYIELDEERVLVLTRYSGRGKTSGVEIAQMRAKGANVFRVRDGSVTQRIIYFDRDHALADLGLKE